VTYSGSSKAGIWNRSKDDIALFNRNAPVSNEVMERQKSILMRMEKDTPGMMRVRGAGEIFQDIVYPRYKRLPELALKDYWMTIGGFLKPTGSSSRPLSIRADMRKRNMEAKFQKDGKDLFVERGDGALQDARDGQGREIGSGRYQKARKNIPGERRQLA